MKFERKTSKIKNALENYVIVNKKEYILVALIFLIGIFVGVMIINNSETMLIEEISKYIEEFITKFKETPNIDKTELIVNSIKEDILLAITIWIAGTTVIGIPIVFFSIAFRGICLGYTIAAITYTIGTGKGIMFCIITLCLQNILFIPAVLSLGVSSIKLYKSIIKDRRRENIKVEIMRHTVISAIMTGALIISTIIENMISVSLLQNLIKYF